MDIYRIIDELRDEWKRLDSAIKTLERLVDGTSTPEPSKGKRGRKHMSEEERRAVSSRMKRYWEQRREEPKS